MLRTIAIGMLAVGPVLVLGRTATPITPQEPPSSLEPGAPRGEVTFSHVRERVTACTPKGLVCAADKRAADSRTSIHLVPVASPHLAGEDKRVPVDVAFPATGGTPQEIELGAGTWELEWKDAGRRARFEVVDGDELAVRLSTQNGTCVRQKQECLLRASHTLRHVKLPKDRQR